MTSLATLSARVTGFNHASFYTYTTVVTLDGVSWTLAIRYSKFLAFYDQLRAAERSFKFNFPSKGGFFFTPKPEDRQPRLDAFLQAVTAFCRKRKQPRTMTKLLREFLQVEKKLREAKKAQKAKEEEEQTASDESANEELVEVPTSKEEGKMTTLSDKAQEGKKALINAAFGAAGASAIKDNAMKAKKEEEEEEKKVEEIQVQPKIEEMEEKKVADEEEVKLEENKEEFEVEQNVEVKAEVKAEQKKEEVMTKEPKVEEVKAAKVTIKEVKPTTTSTTTTTTTTMTTTNGSTVVETNVTSRPTASRTVVGKTVTITSNADDTHSFKVEMTEKKASVVTLSAAAKEMVEAAEQKPEGMAGDVRQKSKEVEEVAEQKPEEMVEFAELKPKEMEKVVEKVKKVEEAAEQKLEAAEQKLEASEQKPEEMVEFAEMKPLEKKRSQCKKDISKAPLSSASTASDGFESPGGVDDVARVSDLSESQKKARNQRRKEKRKKKQKKVRAKDLEA